MSADRDASPMPDIVLERYRLGELPRHERIRLEQRIAQDASLRARVDALDASDADVRRHHQTELVSEGVRRRLVAAGVSETGRRAWRTMPRTTAWVAPGAVLIVAAALIVIVAVARTPERTADTAPGPGARASEDRIKGLHPALAVFRRTPDGSETLADGAIAHAGDVVRVGYRPAGKSFGVIVCVDRRGGVTVHPPRQGTKSAVLKSDATVLLDEAYELDDAPRWERFYFVAGDGAFDVAPIVAAARRAAAGPQTPAALALSPNLEQTTFSLRKEARP